MWAQTMLNVCTITHAHTLTHSFLTKPYTCNSLVILNKSPTLL